MISASVCKTKKCVCSHQLTSFWCPSHLPTYRSPSATYRVIFLRGCYATTLEPMASQWGEGRRHLGGVAEQGAAPCTNLFLSSSIFLCLKPSEQSILSSSRASIPLDGFRQSTCQLTGPGPVVPRTLTLPEWLCIFSLGKLWMMYRDLTWKANRTHTTCDTASETSCLTPSLKGLARKSSWWRYLCPLRWYQGRWCCLEALFPAPNQWVKKYSFDP